MYPGSDSPSERAKKNNQFLLVKNNQFLEKPELAQVPVFHFPP
jgi:hypothetical protein